jgi:putative ABC transport system substrate-binding protein
MAESRWIARRGAVSRRGLLGAGAVALVPRAARAQAPERTYRLGVVVRRPRDEYNAIFTELSRLGFVEGRNLVVDPRGFDLAHERLETVAAEIAGAQPDAIFCGGEAAAVAGRRATTTIPIVAVADDFLRNRLVASLARPGGNLTGISILADELNGKRLELLIELLPGVRRIGMLADPRTASPDHLQALTDMAQSRGVALSTHIAETKQQIVSAIEAARAEGAEALNVLASAFLNAHRALIIERVALRRLPAIYQFPELCAEGGLAGYGTRLSSIFTQAARMLAKIMAGAKPADLPVQQPTRFELVINLKTAKALGITIPATLFARADEVIE